jgi:hypothetical protein
MIWPIAAGLFRVREPAGRSAWSITPSPELPIRYRGITEGVTARTSPLR